MHGQAHDFLRNLVTHRQIGVRVFHRRLAVEGDGVMHGGGDAIRFERFLGLFAIGYADGVLGPGADIIGEHIGSDYSRAGP